MPTEIPPFSFDIGGVEYTDKDYEADPAAFLTKLAVAMVGVVGPPVGEGTLGFSEVVGSSLGGAGKLFSGGLFGSSLGGGVFKVLASNNMPEEAVKVLKALGLPEQAFEAMQNAGITPYMSAKQINFSKSPGPYKPDKFVALSPTIRQFLLADKLGPNSKHSLLMKVEKALDDLGVSWLVAVADDDPVEISIDDDELLPGGIVVGAALNKLPKKNVGAALLALGEELEGITVPGSKPQFYTADAPGPAIKWSKFDTTKLGTAGLVKLRDASRLYQPVAGTTAGKRYYLVAGCEDLRVAVKYQGTILDIRVEGPGFVGRKHVIQKAGINVDGAKDYASLHLSVPDEVLARKALGAVLLALGCDWQTGFPDLGVVRNH